MTRPRPWARGPRRWTGRPTVPFRPGSTWSPRPSSAAANGLHSSGRGQPALLVDAFPLLGRASMRIASPLGPGRQSPGVRLLGQIPVVSTLLAGVSGSGSGRRRDPDGDWGAAWVEVRGRRGRSEEILV